MISKTAWRFLLLCYFSPPLILIGVIFALGFYYRPTVEYAYVDALDLRESPGSFSQYVVWLGIPAAVLAYMVVGVVLVVATIRRRRRA